MSAFFVIISKTKQKTKNIFTAVAKIQTNNIEDKWLILKQERHNKKNSLNYPFLKITLSQVC